MKPAFRTDQIGSLIRPPELLDARDAFKAGKIAREALRAVEDAAVLGVLKMQADAGMSIFTDGEMRRDAWQTVFSQAVDGFEAAYPIREQQMPDGRRVKLQMHTKAINGKLRQHRRLAETDAAFLKLHSPGPFKITMPSPAVVARASYKPGVTDKVYPDRGALLAEVTAIVKNEMARLATDGAAYLQLDEGFTVYGETDRKEQMIAAGEDPERAIDADIAAENACYDAVRGTGVTVAMHLCRGSRSAAARGSGSYDWLAERLFDKLAVDRFLLEYDSDRVGGFEPLRNIPKGKTAVLGLVSSTNPALEDQSELLRRIEAASRFCPVERLAISAQCGFQGSGSRDGAHMTIDQQRRKLELLADTARRVWN
jgi:5-methyltetrahydropteroyltriglutamate--homocysteine methyltransferase